MTMKSLQRTACHLFEIDSTMGITTGLKNNRGEPCLSIPGVDCENVPGLACGVRFDRAKANVSRSALVRTSNYFSIVRGFLVASIHSLARPAYAGVKFWTNGETQYDWILFKNWDFPNVGKFLAGLTRHGLGCQSLMVQDRRFQYGR